MRSLAEQQGNCAIGVILSGLGSDGTLGMAEIQAQGGVTFAQDEGSAKYDSMPRSVIDAGSVDYVLPPKSIARELVRIARHPYLTHNSNPEISQAPLRQGNGLGMVFQLLRRSTGLDFGHYRQTTILRRIERRMVVHKIGKLENYVRFLQTNPVEIKALYQDMLISVTSFFRNPAVFEAIKAEVFPEITKNRSADRSIRIWTPACASGEETYSVAIALLEYLGSKVLESSIQFFGTDVNEGSVARARSGVYPDNIQADVSAERLKRFFTKIEGGYRISKSIRDMCVFAQHNLLNDPPFSQMDLICCRNLLIYLEPVLQNKVISLFHYATRPQGFLVVGASEGIGSSTGLFTTVDRNRKIFEKKVTASRQVVSFSLNHVPERVASATRLFPKQADLPGNYLEVQKEFDRRVLNQYSPATVFVNGDLEIIHTRGSVNRFLKMMPGRASLSILKMAQEGLQLELRNAVNRSKKENVKIRKDNLRIKDGDEPIRKAGFEITPIGIGNLKERYYMIVFYEESDKGKPRGEKSKGRGNDASAKSRVARLEQELSGTKEYLQSVVEAEEAINEELQSANEEIVSSNEELQSTNEELETAKEELQSTNEELSTVNDELRSRNFEITQVNNDLTNLLGNMEIAIVMIRSDLTIRRFTPEAQTILGLIPNDVGRPLLNIRAPVEISDLDALVKEVMSTLKPISKELADRSKNRYLIRILPYRTPDNKIDGAVITIIPITADAS